MWVQNFVHNLVHSERSFGKLRSKLGSKLGPPGLNPELKNLIPSLSHEQSHLVPNCGTFWQIFTPLCIFSGFHCFHFQYELFWPFPFKPPQILPCRIQSRRPKFWTKFWTKFPQTSFTVNQDINEVLNSHKRIAVYCVVSNKINAQWLCVTWYPNLNEACLRLYVMSCLSCLRF